MWTRISRCLLAFLLSLFAWNRAVAAPVDTFTNTFPLGTLSVTGTAYLQGTNVVNDTYTVTKVRFTTRDVLSVLQTNLGVVFPPGSFLEVYLTPYDIHTGYFSLLASSTSIMVTNRNGQSWNVSSYLHLDLPDFNHEDVVYEGHISSTGFSASATSRFMGGIEVNGPGSSVTLVGPTSFKSTCSDVNTSGNLAVNSSLQLSASGAGTFMSQPAFVTVAVTLKGKSSWHVQ